MQEEQNAQPNGDDILASLIARDIDTFSYTFGDGFRNHLGASQIGGECLRQAWYAFRWCALPTFAGKTDEEQYQTGARMNRLWNRGHLEEARFIEYLRGIGWTVYDIDTRTTKDDGTHPQFRIKGHKGHFGGSLDAVGVPPARYGIKGAMLIEFKTASHKSFLDLKKHGVKKSKPRHYSQMCLYGHGYGLTKAVYMCADKDTDALHIEVVDLDPNHALALHAIAASIIDSQTPPDKITKKPNFVCKMCDFIDICHNGAKSNPSCRSCKFNLAVDNGGWMCQKHNMALEKEQLIAGCADWSDINAV